jgi:hypothetical protein
LSYRDPYDEDYRLRRAMLAREYGRPARGMRPVKRYRTHRKTGKHYPVREKASTIEVTNRKFAQPYDIESVTRDGRKFNIRVMALSQDEAVDQAMKKFPLITITKIHKGSIGGGRNIGGKLTSAGRVAKTLGRTAERIAKFIDTESAEEKRLAEQESRKPREEQSGSIL